MELVKTLAPALFGLVGVLIGGFIQIRLLNKRNRHELVQDRLERLLLIHTALMELLGTFRNVASDFRSGASLSDIVERYGEGIAVERNAGFQLEVLFPEVFSSFQDRLRALIGDLELAEQAGQSEEAAKICESIMKEVETVLDSVVTDARKTMDQPKGGL